MITITPNAAAQIRIAADQSNSDDIFLRLAARREDDGAIEYGMGFDEIGGTDELISSQGIDVIIASSCADLLKGATLDYVEISPGDFRFIFSNPNDKQHKPAQAPNGQE
jgi:iron-sulfur cluster assembly protein